MCLFIAQVHAFYCCSLGGSTVQSGSQIHKPFKPIKSGLAMHTSHIMQINQINHETQFLTKSSYFHTFFSYYCNEKFQCIITFELSSLKCLKSTVIFKFLVKVTCKAPVSYIRTSDFKGTFYMYLFMEEITTLDRIHSQVKQIFIYVNIIIIQISRPFLQRYLKRVYTLLL